MTVRCLDQRDWRAAEALYHELTKSGSVADEAMFRNVLAHPGTRVVGKDIGGQIVSMVTLHVLPNMTYGGRPYALIENVITGAAHRKHGHARAVMEHAIDWARQRGCYKVMLLTGRGRDTKGFYEAVGFNADEKWGMMIRF